MKKRGLEQSMASQEGPKAGNLDIQKGGVFAGGREFLFQEREIWKNRMWMYLPEEFTILDEARARKKYPDESRPQRIYANPENTVNISFSHRRERLPAGQEREVCDKVGQVVANLYPGCTILGSGAVEALEGETAWIDFTVPIPGMWIYNLLFLTPLQGRLLIGSCNCPKQDKEEWKGLFLQMLATIRSC